MVSQARRDAVARLEMEAASFVISDEAQAEQSVSHILPIAAAIVMADRCGRPLRPGLIEAIVVAAIVCQAALK